MSKLTEEQKVFIVTRLACFETATQIIELLKQEFKITVSYQALQNYDPTTYNGRKLAGHLKQLFYETREKFKANVNDIPIAIKSYRMQALQRMAVQAEHKKNYALAAQLHEQAAKEVGDVYTNRQNVKVNGEVVSTVVNIDKKEYAEVRKAMIESDDV